MQTALTADELAPLAEHLVARGGYRTIVYHRRGYAKSSRARGPGSVVRDAADCRELVVALELGKVHIVGYSYSGAVGMQLAVDAAEHVHTLALIEPPPVHVPSSAESRAANDRLQEARRARGPGTALEEFLTLVIGPDWRTEVEQRLPGAAEQMQRDTTTFFDTDLPALLSWRFDAEDARRVHCPVLHISGTDSGPWFAEVRDLVRTWWPHAEDVRVAGADHSLALTHTPRLRMRSQTPSTATRSRLTADWTDARKCRQECTELPPAGAVPGRLGPARRAGARSRSRPCPRTIAGGFRGRSEGTTEMSSSCE